MAEREATTRIVRQLRGGQITIPAAFRRRLGIQEDALLRMSIEDDELRIRLVDSAQSVAGSPWFRELYELFAPVREESKGMSEEEINSAIDQAVAAVRSKHA